MADVELRRVEEGVTGSVGDQRVELLLALGSRGSIHGESLGVRVDGYWHVESNYRNLDPVGLFLGDYDGTHVFLRSEVQLTPHYSIRHADIFGAVGDLKLQGRIAPVDAPAHGPRVVGIDGQINGEPVTLFVAIAGDLSGGSISGVIGGQQIRLEATRTSITGSYDGPPLVFPLLVGSLLYFL